ncbi:uncharacterized protein LOC126378999 [Pectinophora gossypiella]|uniref:uncharacterized protein LOC126378999 n=1 Tax=Pectinophora gossypiella TaxID=13191 RepID=UPI00214F0F27|nr:uncharacterized protein LOC126378999 [Pectinophora gossypiella]
MSRNMDLYKDCAHIKRSRPKEVIDEALNKKIAEDYRTLPTFEKTSFEIMHIKHYSLENNELLRCRWIQYKRHIEERVFAPFAFYDIRDLHFYNAAIRFMPSVSTFRLEHRMKLKPGPGVDQKGQMPIPQELLMKRGISQKDQPKNKINKLTAKKGMADLRRRK